MSLDKLVHVTESLERDGTGQVLLQLCRGTISRFSIYIIVISNKIDPAFADEFPGNVTIQSIPFGKLENYSLRGYWKIWLRRGVLKRRAKAFLSYIDAEEPDIIHFHTHPRELVLGHFIRNESILIYTDHSLRIRPGQYSRFNSFGLAVLFRKLYKPFHVVAVSESVHEYHRHYKIVSGQRMHKTIVNGVDCSEYYPVSHPSERLTCIYVGRMVDSKNHMTLLKAWKKVADKGGHRLLLVGTGPLEPELKMYADKENIMNVFFLGSRKDVPDLLKNSNIGVFPSLLEGMPVSLLEMMACGLPVIASDISGVREIIRHERNGLLVRPGSADDLSEAVNRLVNDLALRSLLGDNARKTIMNKYNLSITWDAYSNLYQELLKNA